MFIYNLSKQNKINFMEKFRTLKFMTRTFTSRDWRCHKRRVFFESLFEPLKESKDINGGHLSGYIEFDESSYRLSCHDMAADVPYYPFERRSYIDIGNFFAVQRVQRHYLDLKVKIIRISPLWKVFLGSGTYEVLEYGTDKERKIIQENYTKKVHLL